MQKSNLFPECVLCPTRIQSVFSALGKEELKNIDQVKRCVEVKKGETIFEQGAVPRGLFCVNKGKLKVVRIGSEGKEQIVHLAKPGDIMGYRAILGNDLYSCSGIAIENSLLCFIPIETFVGMVEKNARLSLNVMKLFSEELKEAEKDITDIAQKTVRQRLAQTLLVLKGMYGFENDGISLNVNMTREDLAGIVGTARETATRTLQDFKDEHIIDLKGKKIKIINHSQLQNVANIFDK